MLSWERRFSAVMSRPTPARLACQPRRALRGPIRAGRRDTQGSSLNQRPSGGRARIGRLACSCIERVDGLAFSDGAESPERSGERTLAQASGLAQGRDHVSLLPIG
jgi:hypothetical protein